MERIKTRRHYIQAYLDYFNNYLTTELFAEYYELTVEQAKMVLAVGKQYYTTLQAAKRQEGDDISWTHL